MEGRVKRGSDRFGWSIRHRRGHGWQLAKNSDANEKPKDRSAISIPSLKRYQLRRYALGSRHFFVPFFSLFFSSIPQEKQGGISCVTEQLKSVDESDAEYGVAQPSVRPPSWNLNVTIARSRTKTISVPAKQKIIVNSELNRSLFVSDEYRHC